MTPQDNSQAFRLGLFKSRNLMIFRLEQILQQRREYSGPFYELWESLIKDVAEDLLALHD